MSDNQENQVKGNEKSGENMVQQSFDTQDRDQNQKAAQIKSVVKNEIKQEKLSTSQVKIQQEKQKETKTKKNDGKKSKSQQKKKSKSQSKSKKKKKTKKEQKKRESSSDSSSESSSSSSEQQRISKKKKKKNKMKKQKYAEQSHQQKLQKAAKSLYRVGQRPPRPAESRPQEVLIEKYVVQEPILDKSMQQILDEIRYQISKGPQPDVPKTYRRYDEGQINKKMTYDSRVSVAYRNMGPNESQPEKPTQKIANDSYNQTSQKKQLKQSNSIEVLDVDELPEEKVDQKKIEKKVQQKVQLPPRDQLNVLQKSFPTQRRYLSQKKPEAPLKKKGQKIMQFPRILLPQMNQEPGRFLQKRVDNNYQLKSLRKSDVIDLEEKIQTNFYIASKIRQIRAKNQLLKLPYQAHPNDEEILIIGREDFLEKTQR